MPREPVKVEIQQKEGTKVIWNVVTSDGKHNVECDLCAHVITLPHTGNATSFIIHRGSNRCAREARKVRQVEDTMPLTNLLPSIPPQLLVDMHIPSNKEAKLNVTPHSTQVYRQKYNVPDSDQIAEYHGELMAKRSRAPSAVVKERPAKTAHKV